MAAIYQWFEAETVLTTTLYPITDIEYMNVTVTFDDGDMGPVPHDYFEFADITLQSGSMALILYDTVPPDDYYEFEDIALIGGSLVSALVSSEPPDDYMEFEDIILINGLLKKYLIVADSPDEILDLSCAPITTDCSMTPV